MKIRLIHPLEIMVYLRAWSKKILIITIIFMLQDSHMLWEEINSQITSMIKVIRKNLYIKVFPEELYQLTMFCGLEQFPKRLINKSINFCGPSLIDRMDIAKMYKNNTDNDLVLKYEEAENSFGYQEQKLLIWIQDTLKDFWQRIRKDRKFNKEIMPNKILITGFTGQVGSQLADFILENTDLEIHGLMRWQEPIDNIYHPTKRINNKDRVFIQYGDLNDLSSLQRIIDLVRPQFISHLAAQSFPKHLLRYQLRHCRPILSELLICLSQLRIIKTHIATILLYIYAHHEVYGKLKKAFLLMRKVFFMGQVHIVLVK